MRTSITTRHATRHTTHHATRHKATFTTRRVKASRFGRNVELETEFRRVGNYESGGRKWLFVGNRPLELAPAAAYHRDMLHLGRREFLKVGGGLALAGFAPAVRATESGKARSCIL